LRLWPMAMMALTRTASPVSPSMSRTNDWSILSVSIGSRRGYSNPKSVVDVGWVSAQRVTQHNQDVGLRPTA
jgi:hypothetical protein